MSKLKITSGIAAPIQIPKTAVGRPAKGNKPNQRLQTVRESLQEKGFDLGQELVSLLDATRSDPVLFIKALELVARYGYIPVTREDIEKEEKAKEKDLSQLTDDELLAKLNPPS